MRNRGNWRSTRVATLRSLSEVMMHMVMMLELMMMMVMIELMMMIMMTAMINTKQRQLEIHEGCQTQESE